MGNSGSAHNINSERSAIHRNSHFQTRFEHLSQNSRRQFQWSKSGLRSTSLNPQRSINPEWRRSYPSTIMKRDSNCPLETPLKVLPELDKRLHLRATSNGAILNSGGTISGRKQNENLPQNIPNLLSQRSKTFIIENVKDRTSGINEKIDTKPEFARSQTLLYIKGKIKDSDLNANESNLSRMQRHTYSEPELINKISSPVTISNTQEPPLKPSSRNKYSKKRRAPEVPQANITARPFIPSNKDVLRNTQIIKDNAKPMHYAKNSERKQTLKSAQNQDDALKRDNENRKSIKERSFQSKSNSTEGSKIPFRREKSSDAILLRSRKPDQPDTSKNTPLRNGYQIKNSPPVVKNSTQKEKLENEVVSAPDKGCQRTFYFGMEIDSPVDFKQSANTVDEKLQSDSLPMIANYDIEYRETTRLEESLNDNGLLVRIRPTLPRRQVETPSFSPMLAWRSLIEQQDGIDKLQISKSINHNCCMPASETPIQPQRTLQIRQLSRPNHLLTTWTPEQDLGDEHDDKLKGLSTEDDSSSDEYRSKCEEDGFLFYGSKKKNVIPDKVTPVHTFSLSLPRDSHIQHTRSIGNLNTGEVCIYKSLQKAKPENYVKGTEPSSYNQRNSSSHAQLENNCVTNFECSNNWMLHKNISGTELYTKSLEHGGKRQRLVSVEPQSIKFLTGGKHVMYLPGSHDQPSPLKAHPTEPQDNMLPAKTSRHFKSRQRHMPQSLQDKTPIFPIKSNNEEALKLDDEKPFHQRFLFNNPVRLLEKKLHADKSVKPAKLKMSLDGQLEALKKVEEDFQRNRANEKENIQHQLRLYFGTDDEQYHSLPIAPVLDRFSAINLNDTDNKLYRRDDPDGCVSNVVLENEEQTITFGSKNILT
ncbi:uncharacterized protein LOC135426054 [Drosophila montana]|uniref:uncharacterized protein LOC135426054 n=1 Tax=Drosophila montana TaxID=40370 RepID=UPI00313DFBB8